MSSENVYASFGVNNAVMSSSDPVEHEQNMLALDVRARDGDTSIELTKPEEQEETTDPAAEPEGAQEEQPKEEGDEPSKDEPAKEETTEGDDEFEPLGEPDEELKAASAAIDEYADGFAHMRAQAIQNGLTEEVATQIEAEYEADGKLSKASYDALAKAGYSKGFIDSYIRGQEAVAEQFVSKVVDYAGGQDKFQRIVAHMKSTSPESVEALNEAMERQDLKAIRSIINLGTQGISKKLGKAPARSVTSKAPATPQARKAPQAEGYASTAEMIKDMGSDKYRLDPAFRAKVEARVAASKF